jgi:hypothetical protein
MAISAKGVTECFSRNLFNAVVLVRFMYEQTYSSGSTEIANPSEAGENLALDNLLHSKSRILRTKLEVLAAEVHARLTMWDRNLSRIDGEKQGVEQLLDQFTGLARYHLRDQKDLARLRESGSRLESERREEDVQCWRDVVMVMRDFLEIWEAHEQAKNRSIFINHVGTGYQNAM